MQAKTALLQVPHATVHTIGIYTQQANGHLAAGRAKRHCMPCLKSACSKTYSTGLTSTLECVVRFSQSQPYSGLSHDSLKDLYSYWLTLCHTVPHSLGRAVSLLTRNVKSQRASLLLTGGKCVQFMSLHILHDLQLHVRLQR